MTSPALHRSLLAVAVAVACSGAAPFDPPLRREIERADAAARQIEFEWPIAGSGPVVDLVRDIGTRLARHAGDAPFRWRFTVVRDLSANAFVIGGGRIYVNEGTVDACANESELAAILAHEMGHQLAGHLRLEQPGRPGWPRRGSSDERSIGSVRQQIDLEKEIEADRLSLRLLSQAGYDPRSAIRVAERLRDRRGRLPEHIGDERRIDALVNILASFLQGGERNTPRYRRVQEERHRAD